MQLARHPGNGRYREQGLMVRKRRRKKLTVPERQPLLRPQQPNEVWSMDFVFDELAGGRRIKTLTVVDDCMRISAIADTRFTLIADTVSR
jgi:transposase InsO family protein